LAGLKLPHSSTLTTSAGDLLPSIGSDAIWPGAPVPEVVLSTTFPLRYATRITLGGKPWSGIAEANEQFSQRIDQFRLAVLLAIPEQPLALRRVTTLVFDPLYATKSAAAQPSFAPAPVELDADKAERIQEWAGRIAAHFDRSVALAIRRTLSAADQMRDVEDRLVDAVIALEALFGTGNSEVGFRLQTAIAFMLGNTEKARRDVAGEVKRLYDTRSKLVHGESVPVARVNELLQQALELTIRCWQALFTSHTKAIAARKTRGTDIIFGVASPSATGDV